MRNHILVVDDTPVIGYSLVFALSKTGHKVTWAQDGKEALARILEANKSGDRFDLLLTDVRMPRMSGIELVRELRRLDIGLPVLFISGLIEREVVEEELQNGHTDFLMKPFQVREVIRLADALMSKWRLEKTQRISENEGIDYGEGPYDREGQSETLAQS
jgi:DNA-binding response OmpR family regulator